MILNIIAYFIGNISAFLLPLKSNLDLVLILALLIILVLVFCYKNLVYPTMMLLAGMLWGVANIHFLSNWQLPLKWQGKLVYVSGQIVKVGASSNSRQRFYLLSHKLCLKQQCSRTKHLVQLDWYSKESELLKLGSNWQFKVRLYQPHGRYNPGSFNYVRWLKLQHVVAVGVVSGYAIEQNSAGIGDLYWFETLRQFLYHRLKSLAPADENLAIIMALALGMKQEFSQTQWSLFRNTGTTHLLAISGLHIGMVAGIIFFLVKNCYKYSPRLCSILAAPKAAAIFALIFGFFYAKLTGFGVSSLRAVLMLIVLMLGLIIERNSSAWQRYFIALLVVQLLNPLSFTQVGFGFSFMAVFLIFYSLGNRYPTYSKVTAVLRLQLVLFIALVPLSLYLYQQFSIVSVLANLVAIPLLSSIVLPLVLLSLLCSVLFIPAAVFLIKFLLLLLHGLTYFFSLLSSLPYAVLYMHIDSLWVLIAAMLGILLLLAPRGFVGRWLALIWLWPIFFSYQARPEANGLWLTILDAGARLIAVVQTEQHAVVYDSKAMVNNHGSVRSSVLESFLQYNNLNGIAELISDKDCSNAIWELDGVKFSLLPTKYLKCMLHINLAKHSILLLPRLNLAQLDSILEEVNILSPEILVLTYTGTIDKFLDKVHSKTIVIASNKSQQIKFNHVGYNTAESGAIQFKMHKDLATSTPLQYRLQSQNLNGF